MKYIILSILTLIVTSSLAQEHNDEEIKKVANQGKLLQNTNRDTIPIRIVNDLIVLKMKVNDQELKFMWDNGFSFSAIDSNLVKKLQLTDYTKANTITATDGVNNQVDMDLKIAKEITVGSHTIQQTPFLLLDIESLAGFGDEVHGVLGATITKRLNWKFNFDKNYVVVSQKPFNGEGIVIPFVLNDYNTMFTSLEINGIKDGVEIDFGSTSDDIEVTINALELFKDSKKATYEGVSGMSVGGLSKPDVGYYIKDFTYKIGDTILAHPIKLFITSSERGARIGNKMLRNYNCIINSNTNEIILSTRKTKMKTSPEKKHGVIIFKLEDKLKIIGIYNNPNTKGNQDLKLGDEIIEINGKKAADFKDNVALRNFQLELLHKGEKLSITKSDGKVITLLPEYSIYE
ncbi:aspartyl protease family protein [Kordia algicida OT-1]|uniref:PDZ domain-containing protein n=1 Tax=Kordia algicida OT-1 TaxID=391587 RepID=A9E2P6_9FLAO|nr:aspartyl protease family protein [Kordia algicida]EDP95415.1 hypothetical protein KAOT1_10846 [Kordia algicida OT-1]